MTKENLGGVTTFVGLIITGLLVVQIVQLKKNRTWIIWTMLAVGIALWSKLPAVLAIPSLFLYPWLKPSKASDKIKQLRQIGLGVAGGGLLFLALKLHPVFPQLFARGGDFLYPWQEVILQGKWRQTLINVPTYLNYFATYLTWPVLILQLVGQFLPDPKRRRVQHILLLSTLLFAGPIAVLGKVVYPRYLLPVSIPITIAATLTLMELIKISGQQTQLIKKMVLKLILVIAIISTLFTSGKYIYYSLTNPSQTPFVSADQEQYLYKWSSGHGILPAAELITELSQDKKIAVATEGYFGTLPDGLLMYFHQQNVDNVYIEGVGYPVSEIGAKFAQRAKEFDQVLLVVNSHRLDIKLDAQLLMSEFCRPDEAPCLQIWDITHLVNQQS